MAKVTHAANDSIWRQIEMSYYIDNNDDDVLQFMLIIMDEHILRGAMYDVSWPLATFRPGDQCWAMFRFARTDIVRLARAFAAAGSNRRC